MIAIVRIALQRPYTFIVLALLILIIGPLAAMRTPTDIFPNINIPIIARGVAVHRPAARSDVRPHHHAVRARAHDDGQRHRTHRSEFVYRLRHRQDLFPSDRQREHGQCAGHRDRADAAETDAARRDAAADRELQRIDRADPAARAVRQGHERTATRRSRHESVAHAPGHRAGRGDSVAVRRQVAPGADRSRRQRAAGARTHGAGCCQARSPRKT